MIKSIYNASSGMIVQQKRQENIANNLANAETPSFKSQSVVLQEVLGGSVFSKKEGSNKMQSNFLGLASSGVEIDEIRTNFNQGMISETSRDLDYAIDGSGFISIELSQGGEGFTRNGSFKLDANGNLMTNQGYYVLGKDNRTNQTGYIALKNEKFRIEKDGRLFDEENNNIFTLKISDFTNYDDLNNIGNGIYLYQSQDGINSEVSADNFQLIHASKELSNVNVLEEMVKMIEVSRAYESNQRVIQSLDEIMSKIANEVGKL